MVYYFRRFAPRRVNPALKLGQTVQVSPGPRRHVSGNFAGVDIVNLANNHTFNYGRGGFEETKEILDEKGVKWVGDNNLEVVTLKGTVFGFLGFDLTVKGLSQENLELIKKADGEVDVLIVAVHWGVEYTREPTKLQRTQAREIVKAGGDAIAGHHPH